MLVLHISGCAPAATRLLVPEALDLLCPATQNGVFGEQMDPYYGQWETPNVLVSDGVSDFSWPPPLLFLGTSWQSSIFAQNRTVEVCFTWAPAR